MIRVLVYYLVVALGAFGGTFISSLLVPAAVPAPYAWLIRAALVMVLVIVITRAFLARGGMRWSAFGVARSHAGSAATVGALGGLLLAGGWLAVIFWLSPFALAWNPEWTPAGFVAASLGTVAMGIAEETGYRSYGLMETRRIAGYGAAVALSTAIFVAAHVAGGVPWQAALLVVGSSSVLFCVVMLETRSLPLVIALHATTNLVQDNTLREIARASLFTARASSVAPGGALAIWSALAVLNLLSAAGVIAWSRGRAAR